MQKQEICEHLKFSSPQRQTMACGACESDLQQLMSKTTLQVVHEFSGLSSQTFFTTLYYTYYTRSTTSLDSRSKEIIVLVFSSVTNFLHNYVVEKLSMELLTKNFLPLIFVTLLCGLVFVTPIFHYVHCTLNLLTKGWIKQLHVQNSVQLRFFHFIIQKPTNIFAPKYHSFGHQGCLKNSTLNSEYY